MVVLGIILLAIGSLGTCAAVALEIKFHEPIFRLLMKIVPWLMAIGGIIFGLALKGG